MKYDCIYAKLAGASAALIVGLTACGKQTSAVAPSDEAGSSVGGSANAYGPSAASYRSNESGADANANPAPLIDGKPIWAANRKHSAEENARYQFTKNGRDFGASTESDYVRKVHAFVDHPPSDVETLDRRNGDRLLYDPRANVFAVVSRDGAPRTMFKPRDGAKYWDEQRARLNSGGSGPGSSQSEG